MSNELVYIDHFDKSNSNYYWLEAFENIFKKVHPYEVFKYNRKFLLHEIIKLKPAMVHVGGSVKAESILNVDFYKELRERFPDMRITGHYGDAYYNEYNHKRLKYLNAFHTSNYANVTGPTAYWKPCCVLDRWIKEPKKDKKYDVVFVGNNYSGERKKYLKEIDRLFDLHVWGKGWEGFKNHHGTCTVEESVEIYRDAKAVLAEFVGDYCRHSHMGGKCAKGIKDGYQRILCRNYGCNFYAPNICYFSNRVVCALASGSPVISSYRSGMELVLRPNEEVLYHKDITDCCRRIDACISSQDVKKDVGLAGQEKAKEWTYEKAVRQLRRWR